jgi:hypothetical protein
MSNTSTVILPFAMDERDVRLSIVARAAGMECREAL